MSARMSEARILGRTRLRLLLWSGGSTLLVLLVLGGILYAAVARQLAADAELQLRQRAEVIRTIGIPARIMFQAGPGGPRPTAIASDPAGPGFVFGGPTSGTVALIIGPDDTVAVGSPLVGGARQGAPRDESALAVNIGTPDPAGAEEARHGREALNEVPFANTVLRVLSVPAAADSDTYVVQVMADRSPELRTLGVLVGTLTAGGLLVVLAALALGWVYSGRALVPIRDSLRRQREFAADASHELRTPLTVIRTNLEIARGRSTTDASTDSALADAEAEVGRMTRLVDDLLLLARTDSDALELDRRAIDLSDAVTDALAQFAPLANEKGVRLTLDVSPTRAMADPARIRQLAAILVDNAIRHAPRGGRIDVGVQPGHGLAHLVVEDDGSGIDPAQRPYVFDRFWRAPNAPPGGSGLGLAIARWIVERHGGSILVGERDGGGARFEVKLPAG
jgi:two-component system, OmpR family, sensor histidine kinase CiaH